MTKEEKVNELKAIFDDVLSVGDITYETKQSEVEEWDSLGHLRLFMAIEEKFGKSFSIDEIGSISSVAEIVDKL